MKKIYVLLVFCISLFFQSQTIPSYRKVDWKYAGLVGGIPTIQTFINCVTQFGAVGNGTTDNSTALNNAINSLGGNMGVIFFPPGAYFFGSTISVPSNVLIKGFGSDKTTFIFNNGGNNCFNIIGTRGSFQNVNSGYNLGSTEINLSSTSGLIPGNYILINETNDSSINTVPASWAVDFVGQVIKIISINGNNVSFLPPLRIDYKAALVPKIAKITPKSYVGFENFKIKRTESMDPLTSTGHYFNYRNAVNCWISGVEMYKSAYSHVFTEATKNFEVSGCYIHEAYNYDGGGTRGYGICFAQYTSDCIAENNIGDSLRHFIMFKQGANGNVATYNYHNRTYRNGAGEIIFGIGADLAGDISLHGHYPYANLVEGHIGKYISADQSWGPNGPRNTFLRNVTTGSWGFSVASGSVNTDSLNIVGNVVKNSGQWNINGTAHIICSNNVNSIIKDYICSSALEQSFIYDSKPEWWPTTMSWPSIGYDIAINSNTNPAYERYIGSGIRTFYNSTTVASSGTIRYNSSIGKFQGSNGRMWINLN